MQPALLNLRRALWQTPRSETVDAHPQTGPAIRGLPVLRYEDEAEPAFGARAFRQTSFEIETSMLAGWRPAKGDRLVDGDLRWRVIDIDQPRGVGSIRLTVEQDDG